MTREEAVRRIKRVADKKLSKLDLMDLQLEEVPLEIAKCRHLKLLFLTCNQITSIPEVLGQLPNLTELSLGGNQITSIPEWLGQLFNLTGLDLSHNQISYIPKALGQLSNLTELDLSNNQITSIPEVLEQFSNLKSLGFSENQITSIPEWIGQLSNLELLHLGENQITSIPEVLGQLSNLELLHLGENQITSIPEALGQLSNLIWLDLSNNQITGIPEAIYKRKKLKSLDLQGNPVLMLPEVLGYGQDYQGCDDMRTIPDSYSHARNLALPELDAERQKIESEGYFDVGTLQDARRRITASIVQRQGQSEFRRKLLIAYGGRCPITDCDVESAIEAAHIIPYQGTQTNHPTNGLPLRADIHTLFDLHLLSIRPDTNEVVIAPELVGTCYQDLADRKLTLPQDQKTVPNQNALSKHHETFLSKCKSGQLTASNEPN
ncbi:leucine-rich repeat domain-containing protein [Microcoleus sp. POL10_C6]|uniref:leucine-rich repeat domain-containing protein n=1 Tax=Microcoleus sp. POL10_C6 TaxID=2818852 RepID=UPI002FD60BC6